MIFNPCGYVVIEVISNHVADGSAEKFEDFPMERHSFYGPLPDIPDGIWVPLKVSRATQRMEEVGTFYDSNFTVKVGGVKYPDGSESQVYAHRNP